MTEGSARESLLHAMRPLARVFTGGASRILMYHRFGAAGVPRRMSVNVFESQVRYLSEKYRVLTLGELLRRQEHGESPGQMAAITVDDGYGDFAEFAYPVLKKYNVPATVYLVTAFVDRSQWLWFDALHWIAGHASPGMMELEVGGEALRMEISGPESRQVAWERVADAGVRLEPAERDRLVAAFASAAGVSLPERATTDYGPMDWDTVRSLDPALVEWGAHTVNHPILARCTLDDQYQEISGSKRRIEEMLQRPVTSFCYPNGQPGDYDDRTVEAVRRSGFSNAVVAHGGMQRPGGDPFLVRRLGAPEASADFLKCVDGVWEVRHMLQKASRLMRGRSDVVEAPGSASRHF